MILFRMYWRRTLRKPGAILLWLAVPFVFMAIYQIVFGGNGGLPRIGLAIVDQDSTLATRLLKGAFAQGPVEDMVGVVDAADVGAVEHLFATGDASAALVIPPGFGDRLLRMQPDTLTLLTNPRHEIGPQIAEGVVGGVVTVGNGLLGEFREPLKEIDAYRDAGREPSSDDVAAIARSVDAARRRGTGLSVLDRIKVDVIDDSGKKEDDFNMAALFFPGLVMFGLLTVSLRLEHAFLRDRRNRVTHRLVTAPIAPWRVAIEQRLYTASFAYVLGIVAGVLGGIIWRIPPHGLVTANFVILALALFIAGINGILFSLTNSPRAVSAISSLVMIFLTILGGGFFPAEFTPAGFQAFAKWIPTGAANLALTHSLTGRDVGISVPIFAGTCLALFVAGVVAGRKRLL